MAASVRWTWSTTARPRPGWISPVVEVEGELLPGDLADGNGAAYVEGLGGAEVGQLGGGAADGGLEVQRVGEIQAAGDLDGAGGVDEVGLDVEASSVRGALAALRGLVGVVAGQGLLDQPADLGPRARPGRRGECPVDLGGRGHREAEGVLGDPHRPPHRHPPGHHLLPESREAVAQLEGLADVGLAGVGRQAQRGGVLHQRELRDQRSPRAGDRQGPVAEQADLVRGPLPVGFDGVLDRPVDGELESFDLDVGGRVAVGAQRTEEGLGGGLRCFGHGSIAAPATDSRTPKSGLCTGVGESSWVKFSRSTAGVLSIPRRWLRCERSEPRNHLHGMRGVRGFVARA